MPNATDDHSNARKRIVSNCRGNSAVEFALILPLLMAVLFAIVSFGSYLATASAIQSVASDAARAAVAGLDNDERVQLALSSVAQGVSGNPLIDPNSLKASAYADPNNSEMFTVSLNYRLDNSISSMFSGMLPLPKSMTRKSSIRRGGVI